MTEKKKKLNKKLSIEDLYQNKNFVMPKEKNLETIFEEPRKAKNGAPILTSTRKYKRYLHFDPTEGKIHKRKLKMKKMKCVNKSKIGKRTRSTSKISECGDISLYILQVMGESSDSEMEEESTDVPKDTEAVQPNAILDDSEQCSKQYEETAETESAVSEETEPKESSRSSCVVA